MKAFGTNEYGNREGFIVKCNKCGKEARLVPIHHYDDSSNLKKITLELRCICGNKYGTTIHSIKG